MRTTITHSLYWGLQFISWQELLLAATLMPTEGESCIIDEVLDILSERVIKCDQGSTHRKEWGKQRWKCILWRKHKFLLAAVNSLTKCHTDCENKRRVGGGWGLLTICESVTINMFFNPLYQWQLDFWLKKIITWSKLSPDVVWRGFKYLLESESTLYLQLKIDSMICVRFLPGFKGRIQIIESLFFLHLSYPERL